MKKSISSFLKYIVFFPLLCSSLGLLGIPIGFIFSFFKTGFLNFVLKDELDVVLFSLKIGGCVGFILGVGLWILGIFERK